MKIKKGDKVVVITGKDRGKKGDVMEVLPQDDRVLIDGVNIVTRHRKPKSAQDKGGIIKKPAPIHISNVMIVCSCGKATRVGHKLIDGKKVRVCKVCGKSLDKEFVKVVKKEAKKSKASTVATKPPAKIEIKKNKTEKEQLSEKAPVVEKPTKKIESKQVVQEKNPTIVRKTVGRTGK